MNSLMYTYLNIHPWLGTQHCLRETVEGEDAQCCNDHTGCIWNDSNNTCMFDKPSRKKHDSPLLKKNEA
jgi:hypothetical protein